MGFSAIGSFIIMYFGIIIIITSVFMMYSTLLEGSITLGEQQDREYERLKTSITIDNVHFEKTVDPDLTSINITNDGSRKLELDEIDVYIDDVIIPRSSLNRTIGIISNNVLNPLHFDPDEQISINVSLDLADGTHIVVVATSNGVIDTTTFSYP